MRILLSAEAPFQFMITATTIGMQLDSFMKMNVPVSDLAPTIIL